MYVITGATGRTGRATALRLLELGRAVRVVGRDERKLRDLAERGAEVREADQSDAAALAAAFDGAEAAYLVIQPNYIPDHPDFAAFQDRAAAAITEAVDRSGLPRAVALSSWGAQHPEGTGPVAGLHRFEESLSAVPVPALVLLRAGYFMENLLDHVDSVRTRRRIIAPFDREVPLPLVTTNDVGNAAADELARTSRGTRIRELQGERHRGMSEVAEVIGAEIGAPVDYETCDVADFEAELRRTGVTEGVARMMAEVPRAVNSGHLRTVQPRTPDTTTPTSLEAFVRTEFAPALNA